MMKIFIKEETQMANKHLQRCSTSVKSQLKQLYNILHTSDWQNFKSVSSKHWQGYDELTNFIHY